MSSKAPTPHQSKDESPSISEEPVVARELPGMPSVPQLAKRLGISPG